MDYADPLLAVCIPGPCVIQEEDDNPGLFDPIYDNQPYDSQYSGNGVRIGIFDTGVFDHNHSNFDNIYTTTLIDTGDPNNTILLNHPTIVGSIIGGENGIAKNGSVYYIDANSLNVGYTEIEAFFDSSYITDGNYVDVINISFAANDCMNGFSNIQNLEYVLIVEEK